MNYKFLFLVGSALEHFAQKDFSRYNTEQRFYQTLDTIKSIKEKVPDAYICLFECSYKPIADEYKEVFIDKVDLFLEFYDEPVIKTLYENFSQKEELITYGKSLLETRGILNCLYLMKEKQLFTDVNRIFKLTGRYILNEDFNICDYESRFLEERYVAKTYRYIDIEKERMKVDELDNIYAYLYQAEGMIVTGLWSFDKMLFNETIEALERSFIYLEKMIQYTSGNDIEHALYRFMNKEKIILTSNLGLNVNKGMETANYSI
jgi:hypothetical protein